MTNIKIDRSSDREWLRRMADAEDRCASVSVGGLAHDLGMLDHPAEGSSSSRRAFGRLIEMARRMKGLSPQDFAAEHDVEVEEIVALERGEPTSPDPRTMNQLAKAIGVPVMPLLELVGYANQLDPRLNAEAVRFAACSQPQAKLTADEERQYRAFVKAIVELSDRK